MRLIGELFAVRPDNPLFRTLLSVTAPLVWPWLFIDRWLQQPRFGARLEFATLAAMMMVVVIAGVWSLYRSYRGGETTYER